MEKTKEEQYKEVLKEIIEMCKKKDVRLDLFEDIKNIAHNAVYGDL